MTPACPQPVTSSQPWATAMWAAGEVGAYCLQGSSLHLLEGAHSLQAKGWIGHQQTLVGQLMHITNFYRIGCQS